MSTHSVSEVIDQDRRQLLSNAAMGFAAASAASLIPAFPSKASTSAEIRPFRVHFPDSALVDLRRRDSATFRVTEKSHVENRLVPLNFLTRLSRPIRTS